MFLQTSNGIDNSQIKVYLEGRGGRCLSRPFHFVGLEVSKSVVILSDLSDDKVVSLFKKYADAVGMFDDYIEDCVSEMGDNRADIVRVFENELGSYLKIID